MLLKSYEEDVKQFNFHQRAKTIFGKFSRHSIKKLTNFTQPRGGGKVSLRKSVVQSACQYDVTSRVSNFQNGEQSVHPEETDKNFDFITEILFQSLGFGDFKVSIVIEN